MKKAFVILAAMLCGASVSEAALRSNKLALAEAEVFMSQRMASANVKARVALNPMNMASTLSDAVYIYNNEETPGFVMMSASDKLRPVLGYSTSGTFDFTDRDQMPDNLRSWLRTVEMASEYLEQHPECALTAEQIDAPTQPVQPILGDIMWTQDNPFNIYCPMMRTKNAAVGCVATAGAQVVYHYRYPEHPHGSYGYSLGAYSQNQFVNFDEHTYDYDKMFPKYTYAATQEQINEVAKLSYHCGVMSRMEYGEQSATYEFYLRRGLVENFGYDELCELLYRQCYTYDEWQAILQNELYHNRPIIFSGQSDTGGHCFVVDGINQNGLYHVNWGWGGRFDGYFDIMILRPSGVGTGAMLGEDGFTGFQTAIVNIAPKGMLEKEAVYYPQFMGTFNKQIKFSTKSVKFGEEIVFSTEDIYNHSASPANGYFGLAFVQDGKIVSAHRVENYPKAQVIGTQEALIYMYILNKAVVTAPELPEGDYRMYLAYQPATGSLTDRWGIVHFAAYKPSYINCHVENGEMTFTEDSYEPKLAITECTLDSKTYYMGTPLRDVSMRITNEHPTDMFAARYFMHFNSPSGEPKYVEADNKLVKLEPGESAVLNFRMSFVETGTWSASLELFRQNVAYSTVNDLETYNGWFKMFEVEPDVTMQAEFTLNATPELIPDEVNGEKLYIGNNATFRLNVTNSGEYYKGHWRMKFLKSSMSTTAVGYVETEVEIGAGETKEVLISGELTPTGNGTFATAENGTQYYIRASYEYSNTFRDFNGGIGISSYLRARVYPTPTDINTVEAGSRIQPQHHFDLSGRKAADANSIIVKGNKLVIETR